MTVNSYPRSRSNIRGLSVKTLVLLTVGLPSLYQRPSWAEENGPIPARFGRLSAESGSAPTVFASLGQKPTAEYIATTTSPILPGSSAGSRLLTLARSEFAGFTETLDITNLIYSPNSGEIHHLGNDSYTGYRTELFARGFQCGPSRFTPEAIRALVQAAARRQGIDETFAVAVAVVESDLDQNRNSPARALGPMQLVPATAARFGVMKPCDSAANIDAGVRYLGLLLQEFQNPILALAAYNAGEDSIYNYGGVPPFPETIDYIAKVINHQLGIPAPRRRSPGQQPASRQSAASALDGGDYAPGKTRQWVAGVMQF